MKIPCNFLISSIFFLIEIPIDQNLFSCQITQFPYFFIDSIIDSCLLQVNKLIFSAWRETLGLLQHRFRNGCLDPHEFKAKKQRSKSEIHPTISWVTMQTNFPISLLKGKCLLLFFFFSSLFVSERKKILFVDANVEKNASAN